MQFKAEREFKSQTTMAKQSVQWPQSEGKLWRFPTTKDPTDKRRALLDCTSPNQKQQQQLQQRKQQFKQLAPQDAIPQAATNRRIFQARLGWLMFLVAASLMLLVSSNSGSTALVSAMAEESSPRQQQSAADTKAALEAELNTILQQQQEGAPNSKLLSEAIISRLMLGNLSDIGPQDGADSQAASPVDGLQLNDDAETNVGVYEAYNGGGGGGGGGSAANFAISQPEAQRLRRILSYLQNYELGQQYPVLPVDQAATIKRASIKMGNYLRQQSQHQHGGQRQLSGYGRVNSFDFGLGKRPDSSAGAANILRFGDSAASAGSHLATVSGSGLGKRPSAHRYDFGLGKRVASPAYPRYDFGLGKRAPGSRIRYDFGLGK